MKKSCAYCGMIHNRSDICPKKPKRVFRDRGSASAKFRSGGDWRKKAIEIKERDGWKCAVCAAGLYPYGAREINCEGLEVHHIVKLREDIEQGLNDENLITLCPTHHKMADRGEIPTETLKELIK